MKTNTKFYITLMLVVVSMILVTCKNPTGDDETREIGTFTINLGGNSRAAYPPDIPTGNNPGGYTAGDLKFVVKFLQGGAVKGTFEADPGTTTLSGKIATGDYTISVEVFLVTDSSLLAIGGATGGQVTIVAGNNDIHVTLNKAITVSPSSGLVPINGTQQFSAAVFGITSPNFNWTVTGQTQPGTTINSSTGLLTIASGETDGDFLTITAESLDDPRRKETVTVEMSTAIPLTGTLTIAGCCTPGPGVDEWVNATLTATFSGTGSGTPTIQWQRNGGDIPGAVGSTYVVADSDRLASAVITASIQYDGNTGIVMSSNSHGPIRDLTGIYNRPHLEAVNTSNTTRAGNYILADDINLSGPVWTPIGAWSTPFAGNFDGNGKIISNLTINTTSVNQGLFGVIGSGAIVKDFDLSGINVTGGQYTGTVAGYNTGTIQNCNVLSGNVTGSSTIGGVAGISVGVVQDCSVAVLVDASSASGGVIGGLVGQLSGGQVINCHFTNIGVTGVNGYQLIGGVVGLANTGSIQDCSAATNVTGTGGFIGGIVGQHASTGSLVNCNFSGNVSGGGESVGGVAGEVNYSPILVENCYAVGTVKGTQYVGGVVGHGAALNKCYFQGDVEGTASFIGGVAGAIAPGLVQNCYAIGTVAGIGDCVGGVIGELSSGSSSMQNCYSTSVVKGSSDVGGVFGKSNASPGNMANCVALNPNVETTASTSSIGRISGNYASSGSYARNDMTFTVTGVTSLAPSGTTGDKNGADVSSGTSSGEYNDQDFWEFTMGWDFASGGVWQMSAGPNSLPVFQ